MTTKKHSQSALYLIYLPPTETQWCVKRCQGITINVNVKLRVTEVNQMQCLTSSYVTGNKLMELSSLAIITSDMHGLILVNNSYLNATI